MKVSGTAIQSGCRSSAALGERGSSCSPNKGSMEGGGWERDMNRRHQSQKVLIEIPQSSTGLRNLLPKRPAALKKRNLHPWFLEEWCTLDRFQFAILFPHHAHKYLPLVRKYNPAQKIYIFIYFVFIYFIYRLITCLIFLFLLFKLQERWKLQ